MFLKTVESVKSLCKTKKHKLQIITSMSYSHRIRLSPAINYTNSSIHFNSSGNALTHAHMTKQSYTSRFLKDVIVKSF